MKKNIAVFLTLFFVSLIYSQKTIENPKTGFTTAPFNNPKNRTSNSAGLRFSVPKIKSNEGASMEEIDTIHKITIEKLVFTIRSSEFKKNKIYKKQ